MAGRRRGLPTEHAHLSLLLAGTQWNVHLELQPVASSYQLWRLSAARTVRSEVLKDLLHLGWGLGAVSVDMHPSICIRMCV